MNHCPVKFANDYDNPRVLRIEIATLSVLIDFNCKNHHHGIGSHIFGATLDEAQLICSQVTDHLPLYTFRKWVQRYQGNRYVKQFRCLDQYLVMAFDQVTYRGSLRDIKPVFFVLKKNKLYHGGGFEQRLPGEHWQIPTNNETGESTPTSLSH